MRRAPHEDRSDPAGCRTEPIDDSRGAVVGPLSVAILGRRGAGNASTDAVATGVTGDASSGVSDNSHTRAVLSMLFTETVAGTTDFAVTAAAGAVARTSTGCISGGQALSAVTTGGEKLPETRCRKQGSQCRDGSVAITAAAASSTANISNL